MYDFQFAKSCASSPTIALQQTYQNDRLGYQVCLRPVSTNVLRLELLVSVLLKVSLSVVEDTEVSQTAEEERPMPQQNQTLLKTIWRITDKLWQQIKPILDDYDPPNIIGRKRIDARAALDAIVFRLRSGCQWNQLPDKFPDDSSVHRTFQRWEQNGVLDKIWAALVEECEELGEVDWQWQSADAATAKARFSGDEISPNPTDRAKPGTKHSVLVEADGEPLAVVVGSANVHDCKLLEATLEAIILTRPNPQEVEQHLCLDKGYDNPTGRNAVDKHHYTRLCCLYDEL